MVRKFLKALPRLTLIPQRERSAISPVSSPTAHNFGMEGLTGRTKMCYNFIEDKTDPNRHPSTTSEKQHRKLSVPLSPKFSLLADPIRLPIPMDYPLKSPPLQGGLFQKDSAETAKEKLQKTKNFDDMLNNGFYNESIGQYEETLRFSLTPNVAKH
ncbi:hypothetical protein K493DRAFT_300025 [Basidiobolus meristosporus CBS 931.73]|uniref:Uncharacterized protein n=1 Tax=Basidiobolus meristosporus CBS 931.73 TaxID=1314790 RepID=A0A1Y1YJL8_9FUNG|nr:hypothetical protein K493DRAFT_300025 [Basidiobolus meristosporus CBS 931.73]|eukprot:ORX98217.1 hypothetical protein K493DRAFT_300025 [Basidiobolus meristosporus CBS 931.73]